MKNLILFICLSGCNPFWYAKNSSEDIQNNLWAKKENTKIKSPKVYCYKFLGGDTCFSSKLQRIPDHNNLSQNDCSKEVKDRNSFNAITYYKRIYNDLQNAKKQLNE